MFQRMRQNIVWSMIVLATSASPARADDPPDTILAYHHASTVFEGFFRGIADAMRSLGDAAKRFSEAEINEEIAKQRRIENHQREVTTWFDLKKVNLEWQRFLRGPRHTQADYARWAAADKPRLLNGSELDPVTGQLKWPILLQIQEFGPYRQIVERVFARWIMSGTLSWDDLDCVQQTTDAMLAMLKARIHSLPQMEYMDATNFLKRLSYTARQKGKSGGGFQLASAAGQQR
jgi:hypothetical protein